MVMLLAVNILTAYCMPGIVRTSMVCHLISAAAV